MNYDHLSQPLNEFARIVATNTGRTFTRRIEVSTQVKDISARKRSVRIHPDTIKGVELGSLMLRVFELCDDFDERKSRARTEAIQLARQRVAHEMEYLLRHDAGVEKWINNLIQKSKDAKVQTPDPIRRSVQLTRRRSFLPAVPSLYAVEPRSDRGEVSSIHPL